MLYYPREFIVEKSFTIYYNWILSERTYDKWHYETSNFQSDRLEKISKKNLMN